MLLVLFTYYALFEVEEYTVQFNIGDTTMGGWADGSSNVTKQTANPIPYNTAARRFQCSGC